MNVIIISIICVLSQILKGDIFLNLEDAVQVQVIH